MSANRTLTSRRSATTWPAGRDDAGADAAADSAALPGNVAPQLPQNLAPVLFS